MNNSITNTGISQEHIDKYLLEEATREDCLKLKGIIYLIFNTYNNKGYTGKTLNTFNIRYPGGKWWLNRNDKPINKILDNVIKKYGYKQFKIIILEININDKKIIREREKYWAKLLNTYTPNGYNIKECGNGAEFFGDYKRHPQLKTYKIKDIKTEKIIIINDLPKWCKENNISEYGIRQLLCGDTIVSQGFCLPETNKTVIESRYDTMSFNKCRRTYKVKEIETGNIFEFNNISRFCRDKKIGFSAFSDMMRGKTKTSYGFILLHIYKY